MSMVDKNYKEDDDDIEIVGGSEMDKRVAEKADKNFSKMTLKAQREAAEAFRNSRDNSTEEEEEEQVVKPHKVGRRGRKRKAVVEEDSDSDIEILDSSNDKRFSTHIITPIAGVRPKDVRVVNVFLGIRFSSFFAIGSLLLMLLKLFFLRKSVPIDIIRYPVQKKGREKETCNSKTEQG